MKRLKSTLGLVIAFSVLLAAVPLGVLASHSFTDVPSSNVFHEDISWLADTGVTKGCNPPANTEYCPDDSVTRDQMAAFLHRLGTGEVVDAGWLNGYDADGLLDAAATDVGGPIAAALAEANLATAAYQDVELAEADGWVSTLGPGEGSLGCFEDPARGGMGVHYLNAGLLDSTVDATAPEALVYEMDNNGDIAGLVAHEYIVPIDAWTEDEPPMLFGRHFMQHSVLPLWVLHTWIWKDNPTGLFQDYNPKVRLCPDGVPVFGES